MHRYSSENYITQILLVGKRLAKLVPHLRQNLYKTVLIYDFSEIPITEKDTKQKPCLVLSDAKKIPEQIEEYEFFKLEDGSRIPIIAMDRQKTPGVELKCLKAGVTDFISGPFFKEAFLLRLKRYLPKDVEKTESNNKKDVAVKETWHSEFHTIINELEYSTNAAVITDLDGTIEFANRAVTKLSGYAEDELLGKNARIFSSGTTPVELYQDLWTNLKSGKNWKGEILNKKKDGTLFWESINITPLKDKNDTISKYLADKTDITEQKIFEKELKENQEKFRILTENIQDVIWTMDLEDRKFTFMSPGIYNLRGYTIEEALSQKMQDTLVPESLEQFEKDISIRKQEFLNDISCVYVDQFQQYCKDGKVKWVECKSMLKYSNEGDLVLIGVSRDIDERKETEEKLKEQQVSIMEHYGEVESLLLDILPEKVVEKLKKKEAFNPEYYQSVSVLFTDFVGFTSISEQMNPMELIVLLNLYFSEFDDITESRNLEKLKTIGDSYMCAGGIPSKNNTHAIDCVLTALEFFEHMEYMKEMRISQNLPTWEMRLGIHTGPIVAGLIGSKKFAYDVWGDTVNLASRIEHNAIPGKINISRSTYHYIKGFFDCEYRGNISIKNRKEGVDIFIVNQIKEELSVKGKGKRPNKLFKEKYKSLENLSA